MNICKLWTPLRTKVLLAALATSMCAGQAQAGYITTPDISPIYSQEVFGDMPITINWLAAGATIVDSALASIDSEAEWTSLLALAPDAAWTVDVFFVDSINWCYGSKKFVVGCGLMPGHLFAVKSSFIATNALGDEVIAHELGHNLNLDHYGAEALTGNLMNPTINSSVLTDTQVQIMMVSGLDRLILSDETGQHLFINLRPIAVTAPEPASAILILTALGGVFLLRRRQSGNATPAASRSPPGCA